MEENEVKFEAYFSGSMSEEEIQQFNVELENNDSLKQNYNYFLAVKTSASSIERDNLRMQLASVDIETSSAEEPIHEVNRRPKRSYLPWLLTGIFLIAVTYFCYTYLFSSDNPEQLYASNFDTYQVQAARGEAADDLKQIYSAGGYMDFISIVKEVDKTAEVKMMLANAFMNTNSFAEAEKALMDMSDESSLREQKYWYLGLVYVKMGDIQEAKAHLLHLQQISNYKKKEVENILSKLSN